MARGTTREAWLSGVPNRECVYIFSMLVPILNFMCVYFSNSLEQNSSLFFCGLSTELFQTKKNNFLAHETQQIEPSFFLSRELQELAKVNYFPKWFSNQKPHFLTKQNFLNEHL